MSEEKTEEPTPRREQIARREGRAWQSRDLTLGATLVAFGGLMTLGARTARGAWGEAFERALELDVPPADALAHAMNDAVALAVPSLATIVLVSAATSALQLRGLLATAAIAPDARRLAPAGPGTRTLAQAGLGLVRVVTVALVASLTVIEGMPGIATLARQAPGAAFDATLAIVAAITWRSGLALLGLGVLDAIVERASFRASLRMSRREVERERREVEGDAHVRRERERVRAELWRAGQGDPALVIAGDTLSITLAYEAEDPEAVPHVVAIDRDGADRAHTARVAVDEELATALAIVPIGSAIPEALYDRVAALLARGGD